jgi:hypothetical protein
MKDMTSREILDAFARGLEEATRPFYPQRDAASLETPPHPRASGVSEETRGFESRR